jgi:hypothetical protein
VFLAKRLRLISLNGWYRQIRPPASDYLPQVVGKRRVAKTRAITTQHEARFARGATQEGALHHWALNNVAE